MAALTKLLSIASDGIVVTTPNEANRSPYLDPYGSLGNELAQVLMQKNGFWAYASCLLVRPFQHDSSPLGLIEWNAPTLWKRGYNVDLSKTLFFAEDLFGSQFCICKNQICTFDPETAQISEMAATLEEWAQSILEDANFQTGYPVGMEWQTQHATLSAGSRLMPKKPFVVGGEFAVDNLYECNDIEGMHFRASIANQIADLPDGTEIMFEIEER